MNTNKFRTNAVFFFLFTFGWSLLFWYLTVVFGGIDQSPGSILQYVGGAGPLIAALVITRFFEDHENKREFWSRTFDPQRIPWRWLVAAFLIHPAILFISIVVDLALGGTMPWKTANLTGLGAIANLVFFVFVFGPLPEEMGWRGVGYDRLVQNWNPLAASLILGVAWAAWHIPLFLIEGTFQNQLGFGSFRFWVFLASNIPLTVIITLVYNHTKISILSAAIVHFSGNIIGAILTKTDQLAFIELIGLTVAAIMITARYGVNLGFAPNSTIAAKETGDE
ncbi:MAG TPA: type II CAAX endopeptidase family protein [Anaerolineales bacterium]|nr:type II CAAX endopeptidase family protein [Anaerolineales bacterium]